jgi:hypothetical protein
MALMGAVHALKKLVPNSYLWVNIDSTQYTLSKDETGEPVWTKKVKGKKVSSKRTFENSTNVFVKSYLIMNSHGFDGPLIYCVADNSLDDEAFEYDAIVGLSKSTSPTKVGYLCYTKKRCGNKLFFQWLFQTIICYFF